jgi:vacuolar-type H+-ATPase subunit E/Vma4
MSPRQDDIQELERAILQQASGEARQILADARAKVSSLRQEAQAQADVERLAILDSAHRNADSLLAHTAAEVRVEAQSLRLRRREQLLDRVFDEALQRLASAEEWPDYGQIARFLVREAVGHIDADEMLVQADEGAQRALDEGVLGALGQELGVHLSPGATLARGTGVVLVTPDGHRRFDSTLESRLTRMHERLRTAVYRTLVGEAL